MLQNAYFLAKIGADTAENERKFAENWPKIGNYPTGPEPTCPSDAGRRPNMARLSVLSEAEVPDSMLAGGRLLLDRVTPLDRENC